ncbi:UDP-2,4-diacetamido-2,4,6-trideoxy-beta-L-altropyranose hydrolase [Vibrio sp. Hep-1b-8]|uniref:UDP-2,4-diacetamido-2,4, 6-trideoxy-beta-L-altropyranose hydrolase n=1 Tax=Vibrio sp. Hep-1b-8 TaxID=2144187 RepID=UPI0011107138|nr:UDP-2,4-diacetamido-2,4,6-trideoxy-beta-L-altropyranose hydrolase [Vibrio sp. Hep-1b-8]TMX34655.1 UDP-2,4-diacetamido-2,4,6-trideoxy-beta-L-altropyranose hydrolase [Vibrio sp. Hep-1b-8]
MKVVFRVDASLLIGSGHVMRCLVLADELKRKGHDIVFACTPLESDMRTFISERGFVVVNLPEPKQVVVPKHNADYVSWLQKSVLEDAQDFIATITCADLVITDHYAIDREWQSVVIDSMNCRLFAIDDLARCHRADLILDQTLGRLETDYQESNTRALVGSEYALLQPCFSSKRELAVSRTLSSKKPNVLISMGGIDAPNATFEVLNTLHPQINANFTVLLSPRAPNFQQVAAWCARYSNVTHLEFVSDMASLMLKHDIAIGAPGTTSWERACLGLPNVIVPLADNQKMICEQLVKHQATIKVDLEDISSQVLSGYQMTLNSWEAFKRANLILCDGRGVKRVAYEVEQLFSDNNDGYSIERVKQQDIRLVYEWQCHPETRKYALNTNVPTWDEHQAWMSRKLQSASDYFYMVVDKGNGNKVGAVRLDRVRPEHYLVSIFVEPNSYGKGIASRALEMVDAIHPDVTLHATVLKANLASQKLFQKACYQQTDEETYIRQPIH